MMYNNLRHTNFHVEPIKHIVGDSSTTAYYICVTPGNDVGTLGTVISGNASNASNESIFKTAPDPKRSGKSGSWLGRALSALRF